MKAIEQYFHVVLFIMLFNVVTTLESADKTSMCAFQLVLFVFVHLNMQVNMLFQGFLILNFIAVVNNNK